MPQIIPFVLWLTIAMTCLTDHPIEERVDYFHRLQGDLRPKGRVAHLDDRPDTEPPISWFQHGGHWSESELIDSEMAGAGYRRIATFDFLPAQSFPVFAPESPSSSLAESGL